MPQGKPPDIIDLHGTFVGRYYVEWLPETRGIGGGTTETFSINLSIRKLNATRGKIIVSVYRIGKFGTGPQRYAVRIPGLNGFFGLHRFIWWGNFEEAEGSAENRSAENRPTQESKD